MNVEELARNHNNIINLPYLESSIKTYIKKTNFPKKLVLNKIENELSKIESINKEIDVRLIKLNEEGNAIDKRIDSIRNENSKKISSLLNKLSTSNF